MRSFIAALMILCELSPAGADDRDDVCLAILRQASASPASFRVIATEPRDTAGVYTVFVIFESGNDSSPPLRTTARCFYPKRARLPDSIRIENAVSKETIDDPMRLLSLYLREREERRRQP